MKLRKTFGIILTFIGFVALIGGITYSATPQDWILNAKVIELVLSMALFVAVWSWVCIYLVTGKPPHK